MSLPPQPPQSDDPIITQFKPQHDQWELTDENINRTEPKTGRTILHNYCKFINTTPIEVYRYLIETKGCDINVKDKNKDIPLHHAFYHFSPTNAGADITVLTYLLNQKGINANTKGLYCYTLLHVACKRINFFPLEIFKVLIETHGADVNAQDEFNDTPIHHALRDFNPNNGGDIAVLHCLLTQKNINVTIKNKTCYTILHTACKNINRLPLEIFKVLIETMGCDVNVQDNNKHTPNHVALDYFDPNYGGDITVLNYLLNQEDVNVNIKGKDGYTLLHQACRKISSLPLEIFKVLIETHGADVNAQNNDQDTPLHHAVRDFHSGDITVLMYLLTHAKVDIGGRNGFTLLHIACANIDRLPLQLFKVLIETNGFDPNVQNDDKNTPLHYALLFFNPTQGKDLTVLMYLLDQKGVDISHQNRHGFTLLHAACQNIKNIPLDVFKNLVETKCGDLNLNINGYTPLHVALNHFNPRDHADFSVLTYLLNHKNVNANIKGKYDRTLLHIVCILDISGSGYGSYSHPKGDAEVDNFWYQIVEVIAERYLQEVFDEEMTLPFKNGT